MPPQVLTNPKLWLAQFDLSGDLSKMALEYGAEAVEATVFGNTARRRLGGLKDFRAQHEGLWNPDTDRADPVLFERIGLANVPASIGPLTGADGEVAYTGRMLAGSYAPGAAVGEAFRFSVALDGSGGEPLVRGTILHNAARTTTGSGTARNLGAVGATQKLYAALHVLAAAGGTPTLDVTVQSDDAQGFGTPTTRITFAQATAAGAQWATPVAGPITDTWWRVGFTIGGTTPSFTFVVVAGFAP